MGGKGGGSAPPPIQSIPEPPQVDLAPIMAMMTQMMSMMSQQASAPPLPPTPTIFSEPSIDWRQKQEELRNKLNAQETLDNETRKNRVDTILTSPLLDEEEAVTTRSLIANESS